MWKLEFNRLVMAVLVVMAVNPKHDSYSITMAEPIWLYIIPVLRRSRPLP